MTVKDTARRQYIRQVNQAAKQLANLPSKKEGWIATVRKALVMSGVQLAKRVGVTKAAIYHAEQNELAGTISIKQMQKIAQALDCRFVYAIVPDGQIEELMRQQARKNAQALIQRASSHMALEKQSLTSDQLDQEIERLTEDMLRNLPSDFWGK